VPEYDAETPDAVIDKEQACPEPDSPQEEIKLA